VAKRKAATAFRSALGHGADAQLIIKGAARYRDDPGREPRYTKHPSTWLNGDCWADEPEPPAVRHRPASRPGPQDAAASQLEWGSTITPEEIIDLLTLAAAVDSRDVSQADVAAWHMVIGALPFADALQALVEHYRKSRFSVMSADLRQGVKAIRRTRLEHAPIPAPRPELTDSPSQYHSELQRMIREIADGKNVSTVLGERGQPHAIAGGRE
jgi:hypothetical protein